MKLHTDPNTWPYEIGYWDDDGMWHVGVPAFVEQPLLQPTTEEREAAWASEARLRNIAQPFLNQYERGFITFRELMERLNEISH